MFRISEFHTDCVTAGGRVLVQGRRRCRL